MYSSTEIAKKIKAFHTIEDIVSAMKAYAGVTIRKTEELVINIRRYEENILYVMADLLAYFPDLLIEEKTGKRILIAFGSSQGLCGPFNEKMADGILENIDKEDTLFLIGRRLKSLLESQNINYQGYVDSIVSVSGIQQALKEIIVQIMTMYKTDEYYALTIMFTNISEKTAEILVEQILPPDVHRLSSLNPTKLQPLIYLDSKIIFEKLLEEFLYITLYRAYLESLRSENWYRLRSMEGASESLKKRVSKLSSLQKYVRQEEITEEMLEILGSGLFYK